ncbi:MAG: hypothetical protein GX139_11490 [Armatimonadetes bacterium]|nr:hypothetical protein [Armatimonadota bacterium]
MNSKSCIVIVAALLLATLAMPASADLITFTGNVAADFVGPGVFSQVDTTDQQLESQFASNPPGCRDEPMGKACFNIEPSTFSPSGFNVEKVYWVYDCATDCLYIGLKLHDDAIAWDMNDDGHITKKEQALPATLKSQFSDEDYEEYVFMFGVGQTNFDNFTENFKVIISDFSGGANPDITVRNNGSTFDLVEATWFKGPRVAPDYPGTEKDIEVKICGIRAAFPGAGADMPVLLKTRSGGPGDLCDEDTTEQLIELSCNSCISITKEVACSEEGPFVPVTEMPCTFAEAPDTINAPAHGLVDGDHIRFDTIETTTGINTTTPYYVVGSTANSFKVSTTKGGAGIDLINDGSGVYHKISHVDILAGNPIYFRLTVINCGNENLTDVTITDVGCSGGTTNCDTIAVGDLASGAEFIHTCSFSTVAADCINTATVTGKGEFSETVVTDVDFASVSVLKPSIRCSTLVSDSNDFTNASDTLDLPCGNDVADVYFKLCITNDGQVPISFGTSGPCGITNSLLDSSFAGISGLPIDICAAFRAQLTNGILAPGAQVCVELPALGFDKCALCKNDTRTITNNFNATGLADLGLCGSTNVSTDTCTTTVNVCCEPSIEITKQVACTTEDGDCAQGDYRDSVNALPGDYVCFKVVVTNTGCDDLQGITITDDLLPNDDNALIACDSCCTDGKTIPGTFDVPNLAIGASYTYHCKFRIDSAYAKTGTTVDATNVASVSATGVTSGLQVSDGPAIASVNVDIPSITCSALVSDSDNFDAATNALDLPCSGDNVAQVYYKLCITNSGETPVDFGASGSCGISSSLLESSFAGITGLPADVCALFRAQPELADGILASGDTVCIVVGLDFDKCELCKNDTRVITNNFSATGAAGDEDICGTMQVSTDSCSTTVNVCCQPALTITKEVACYDEDCADGIYGSSVDVLRGGFVCFKLTVTNTGCDDLKDVVITDTLEMDNSALLPCGSCCTDDNSIPGDINVGNLAIGQSKTYYCQFQTNPDFEPMGTDVDATNTANASGVGVTSGLTANAGPSSATVNVLVPKIECTKLVNDTLDFTNATNFFDLGGPECDAGVKTLYYQLCVNNTGDIAIDFTKGDCDAHFADSLLDNPPMGISASLPGGMATQAVDPFSVAKTFLAKLTDGILPAGQSVCIEVAVTFDEETLCLTKSEWANTFTACGLATDPEVCLPPSGGEVISTEGCSAIVEICCPCRLHITKQASCSEEGPFTDSVQAIAGSDVYFKVCVKNLGSITINDVVVTDAIVLPNEAYSGCVECKVDGVAIANCIINDGQWNVGTLEAGEEKCLVCKVKTNPGFSAIGLTDDIVNSASAAGMCATGAEVTVGPVTATVDLLVAKIDCEKSVADNWDMTNSSQVLDAADPMHPQKYAYFQTCVINTGEVDVDFANAGTSACPNFLDPKISNFDALVPGTGEDVNQAMLAELQSLNGSTVLKPGQRVCHVFGPLLFDQAVLCPAGVDTWLNEFSACGIASQDGVCGEKNINTGVCDALVVVCPPTLKQVFCGLSCDPLNGVQTGFGGIIGDNITAVPGVFAIDPGDSQWSNWVAAAGDNVPYTLKNVVLRKHQDLSPDCPYEYPGVDIIQSLPKIQLWWPLMYELPGTTFTLTVYYDTDQPWDPDEDGPKPATMSHVEAFSFKVDTSLPDLKKLLALYHQLPLGSNQVPLISDEALYVRLLADIDEVIDLIAQNNTAMASEKLLDFQLLVENHCIEFFAPTKPLIGGEGTGIANTCENPACCKILADVTWIQNVLGLLHP